MAESDPVFESLQRLQSMMESFDESLFKLCKDNMSESSLDLRKNLEYYHDLLKALQSRYETLKIKEKKPVYESLKIKEEKTEEPRARGKNKKNKNKRTKDRVGPVIKTLCIKANGRGLINYIIENRKEIKTIRKKLPRALSKAPAAAKLVLKALEGYDFSKSGTNVRERTWSLCSANRRACVFLMKSLSPIFGNGESGVVPLDIKESAWEIAKVWRKEMKIEKNAESASPLDVEAFLQLLVTFRIASDYGTDDLCDLMSAIMCRKETPELFRSLGLSSKVPDLMDKLSKSGRPITVLKFARAFDMMDKIDPVDLLTSYLGVAEKAAKELLTNGHGSADSQYDSNMKKLSAVKNAINIVKKYGLQCHFFEDELQKKCRTLVQIKEDLKNKRKKDDKKHTQEKKDFKKADEERIQDLMDNLSKGGKPITVLRFARAYGMMDKIDPVDLLTSYLRDAEKAGKELLTNGNGSADSQYDLNMKPSAVNNAINIIKEYGLQCHVFEDELQKKFRTLVQIKKDSKKKRKRDARKDRRKAAEKSIQRKRLQAFEPGYGRKGRESLKRAKLSSLNETTMAGGMSNSKASPDNIDRVQKMSGIIGHDHNTSAFSDANRSSTGLAAGAFISVPSIAAQINEERRRHPSGFGTINLTPIGSSLCGSSVLASAFAVPLPNIDDVNYESRGQQSYTMNFSEVDRSHVRASIYGTGDLAKSSANQSNHNYEGRGRQSYKLTFGEVYDNPVRASISGSEDLAKSSANQSNHNYEGRGQQSYKLDFGEVYDNPVSTSAFGTGILANPSGTGIHYERRCPGLYASAFDNTDSIGSSVYGSSSHTFSSSDVNQGGHERSLGQYSGFAGRNMDPIESSGYGHCASTVPPSNVTQGHFESRGSVTDKYQFKSGVTSLPATY